MGSLRKQIEDVLSSAPKDALEQLLRPKLKEAGVISWRRGASALAEHLLKDRKSEFHWQDPFDDRDQTVASIDFTEDDGRELERIVDSLNEDRLYDLAERLLKELAYSISQRYQGDWFQYRRDHERSLGSFKNNLEFRWGSALDKLRMLLDLCMDEGIKAQQQLERGRFRSTPHKRIAVSLLHARACQVTSEIICLLENGYANGAMARWRTLYEIDVIATILGEATDTLAERYLDHEIVDQKKAMELYIQSYKEEGGAPVSKREIASINKDFRRVSSKYEKSFTNPYGWASTYLENPSPRFSHLEAAAHDARLRFRYKIASYNVHASSSSFKHNLSNLTGQRGAISGASNAGLAGPGHLTALTLLRVTYILLRKKTSMESIALVQAMLAIRDEAISAFWEADKILREDDAAIQAAVSEHNLSIDTSMV